jgi:hypothetical protein
MNGLIYAVTAASFAAALPAAPAPGSFDKRAVTIWSDGVRMAGDLHLPQDLKPGDKLPAVLFCAGTGGTKKGTPQRLAPRFVEAGLAFLAFDYRGWGESDSRLMSLEFLEGVRSGQPVSGLGRERVLTIAGEAARKAARDREAYAARIAGRRTGAPAAARAAAVDASDIRIGSEAVRYLEPEFLQNGSLAVFADQSGAVWVAEIDPRTGLFRKPDGRQFRIDGNLSKWSRNSNGPEWGLDAGGPAVFYLKDNEQGAGQLWRAEPPWDNPRLTQLTADTDIHNWICGAAVNEAAASTRVIVYRGKPGASGNVDAWIDEHRPGEPTPFANPMVVARWAYNSGLITFAYRARPGQTELSQARLVDTIGGETRVITGDDGNKIDPWLWQAPEFGYESLLAVNVEGRALVICRDRRRDGGPWERIATIALPADAPHATPKSVEPVNGGRGAFGKSYFTVQAGDDADPDTSVWLFGFDTAGQHLVRRLDDGTATGTKARRLDPESLVGESDLFVYYTLAGGGAAQLRLCRTGIGEDPAR